MGLTIHYHIEAKNDWTRKQIRQKLEDTRRFALTLPVVSVSEIAEFRGKDCLFDRDHDPQSDERDPWRWAKIQAGRYVESPWRPGASQRQEPAHMLCLSIYPAEGSEEMNVGCCSYPRFVWKVEKESLPGWSNVFGGTSYRESEKLLRAFLKKYHLVKMPDKRSQRQSGGGVESLYRTPGGAVLVRCGRYLSHRRGYAPNYVEVRLDDFTDSVLRFRFRGTIDEARVLFAGREFKDDLDATIHGKEHVIPAAHGDWSSFCKTVYANNPEVGGWENFQRAHLSVLAVLEHMQQIGFTVAVSDESDFWQTRDLAALAKIMGAGDAMNAEMAGIFQDAREANGQGSESPQLGRFTSAPREIAVVKIDCLAGHLAKLHAALVPQLAVPA
jgi:hypothetical protein